MKFKTRQPGRKEVRPYRTPEARQADEPVGLIQGKTPDSQQEWWVSLWLNRSELQYKYQYVVFPGPEDFYRIDFFIYTVPLATMLELNGGFWHYSELGRDDRLRQLKIEAAMIDVAKIPIRFLWADDMINRDTVEAAMERIFRDV